MKKNKIIIFTDGSTRGKNKRGADNDGGFGVAAYQDEQLIYKYSEQCNNTTNNREELKALEWALMLSQSKFKDDICIIYTDSSYALNCLTVWAPTWEQNNWRKSDKKPIENRDLVESIYNIYMKDNNFPNFIIKKVKGHNGIEGNEVADALAKNNII